jgi:hypothetical protein
MMRAFALAALLALTATALHAETPEEAGLRIARAADAHDAGFLEYRADGRMILRNRQGQTSERGFRFTRLEGKGEEGDKNKIVFDWPPDIKDTALLTLAQKVGDDQQWLFLPALRRVKRVSGANRAGSFVGSEFSYEDLVTQEVEKFTYRDLGEEPCPGAPDLVCHKLERRSVDPDSGYLRQVTWLDRDEFRLFRIDYYDRKDTLLKQLSIAGYAIYAGRHWRPERMVMTNAQNGKSTEMRWADYTFGVGLSDADFTPRALERLR